jgi:hypothetical protein
MDVRVYDPRPDPGGGPAENRQGFWNLNVGQPADGGNASDVIHQHDTLVIGRAANPKPDVAADSEAAPARYNPGPVSHAVSLLAASAAANR